MTNNSKLEFFRFKLNHKKDEYKTFRDYAVEELSISNKASDEKILEACFKHFIQSLKSDYSKDDLLKRRISFEKKKTINKHYDKGPSFNSANFTLHGVINGGIYGRDRILGDNDDEDASTSLGQNKTVLQYYFFCAYLPPDHNEGLFMIHSNNREETITTIFRNYMTKIFKGVNYRQAIAIDFCPKSFQDEFNNNSTVKSISFKTSFVDDIHTTDGISKYFQDYEIKIEAVPKNKQITREIVEGFFRKIGEKTFGSGKNNKQLKNFNKASVVFANEFGNTKTFEWNTRDADFVPVVYLDGILKKKNSDGTPDFDELKEFCFTILNDEILPEIRPDLYVTKA